MNRSNIIILLILSMLCLSYEKTKEEWKGRIIYQILTDRFGRSSDEDQSNCDLGNVCGGTYQGLINHLDYIADMGFNAIWISPIPKNNDWDYHGYAFIDLYALNDHFGDEASFRKFIEECHKRDIWIMLDVVANHCGITNEDFSKINPFNKAEYFHDRCQITDWNNQWQVENCRLCDLPDLKQENDYVKNTLLEWVHNVVADYNIDGIRIDTVPEVPKWFWDEFKAAAGVFQIGEVFNGNPSYVSDYQNHLESVFNYPLYYSMKDGFCGNLRKIEEYVTTSRSMFPDPTVLGVFGDNHDNPRFLSSCNDQKKWRNLVAFELTWEGIPVHYYGGEQYFSGGADPQNREPLWGHYDKNTDLYKMIAKINKARKDTEFYKEDTVQRYADEQFYAFTRGKKVLVCLGNGSQVDRTITYHPFTNGDKLCNVLQDNDCVTVSGSGISVTVNEPKVYVKQ